MGMATRRCQHCGELFQVEWKRGHYTRTTCSGECSAALGRSKRVGRISNKLVEPPDSAEIWRRAAIVRHNNLVRFSGQGQILAEDW